MIRPALNAPDTLGGAGVQATDGFMARWKSANAAMRREDGGIVVMSREKNAALKPLTFTLSDVPATKGRGILVRFEVRGEKRPDFADDVPRVVTVTPRGLAGWPEKKQQPKALLAWATAKDYTPVSFYFREPAQDGHFALDFAVEGQQNISIRNLTIQEATEVFAREFEHGVVLCNPNEQTPFNFDPKKLFPGVTLRRIERSSYDRDMAGENTGELVGDTVTIKPQSGLFLVKVKP